MAEVEPTRLESVEDIRRWSKQAGEPQATKTAAARQADDTPAFAPRHRPPLAMLCLLDDGQQTGQWIRIRQPSLTIGRDKADVSIPFDTGISGCHVRIYLQRSSSGVPQWRVCDLQSTNGTFARVASAVLEPGQEMLVGATRFRFQLPDAGNGRAGSPRPAPVRDTTQSWQVVQVAEREDQRPRLVRLDADQGAEFPLNEAETLIGRDPQRCAVVVPDDSFLSPVHARITEKPSGRWQLENAGARNGTWVRIRELPIRERGEFQIGEQRFVVKVLT